LPTWPLIPASCYKLFWRRPHPTSDIFLEPQLIARFSARISRKDSLMSLLETRFCM
jgi:hypothetical protein